MRTLVLLSLITFSSIYANCIQIQDMITCDDGNMQIKDGDFTYTFQQQQDQQLQQQRQMQQLQDQQDQLQQNFNRMKND